MTALPTPEPDDHERLELPFDDPPERDPLYELVIEGPHYSYGPDGEPFVAGSDTSEESAQRLDRAAQQRVILGVIDAMREVGISAAEIARVTGMLRSSVSGRLRDLTQDDGDRPAPVWITGRKIDPNTGRPVNVYNTREHAIAYGLDRIPPPPPRNRRPVCGACGAPCPTCEGDQ